jgi:hypothetical protein
VAGGKMPEALNPNNKKDRVLVFDVAMGIIAIAARQECGEAIQGVLDSDMKDEVKLEVIAKYAECFTRGKMHYERD